MAEAEAKQRDAFATKELKADSFRLAAVGEPGTPLIGWLAGGVGDADEHVARATSATPTPNCWRSCCWSGPRPAW